MEGMEERRKVRRVRVTMIINSGSSRFVERLE